MYIILIAKYVSHIWDITEYYTLLLFSESQIFHSYNPGVKTSAPFLKTGVEDLLSLWPGGSD